MKGDILSCIPQKVLKSQETFQDSLITSSSCYACNFSPIYNFCEVSQSYYQVSHYKLSAPMSPIWIC